MKHIVVVVILWCIAIVTTLLLVEKTGVFTYLGPVYFICMLGSIITVRRALAK